MRERGARGVAWLTTLVVGLAAVAPPAGGGAAPAADSPSVGGAARGAPPPAGARSAREGVRPRLAPRRPGQVHFVEHKYLQLLTRPVQSSGELIYDAPDRLEKRTTQPRLESLVVAGERLTMTRDGHSRTFDLASHPQALPFVESIRATLAGNRPALEALFHLQFSGDPARWTLRLTPRDAALAGAVREVRIAGAGALLLEVRIDQPDGDHSLMQLDAAMPP